MDNANDNTRAEVVLPSKELNNDIDFFTKIVDLAKKYSVIVIHDFAYADICFDNYKAPSFLQARMKAIILAAGKGTRLTPFTDNFPKGMIKLFDKTLIEISKIIII